MACSCSSYGSYIGNFNCPSQPIPNLGLPCPPAGSNPLDSSNIVYTGPQLNCTPIYTGDNLTNILVKIDAQICSAIGDFTTFNTACLSPTSTLQEFVETISTYVCDTKTELDTFLDTTFPAYQTGVTDAISSIVNPAIVGCSSSGIVVGDNLTTVLTKLSDGICDIYDNKLNISSVPWSQCFVVGTPPVTIADGFSTVITQICQLNTYIQTSGIGGALPIFNTTGSCLPTPSASDSLVSTVNKLIVRVCQTGTFDINALTWGCTTKPNNTTTDLQAAFQAVLTQVNTLTTNFPFVYSGDFVVTNVDNSNPCLGKNIALAVPSTQDRFVAATGSDSSPGTLQNKVTAGVGVTLDFASTPGQMIINSSAGTGDHKVSADITDVSPDFLINKVEAGVTVYGVTVNPRLDTTTSRVAFDINIDVNALFTALISALTPGSPLTAAFCQAVAACPSPCTPPTNVTVTYSSGSSTTTTTTTT
jgi:hypothetical protein